MRIAEIFHSVQGEGELLGVPSVFVRTSGCNLRCGWCDTPYASWRPEGEEMSVDEALARVEACPAAGSRHVVLTGGEPMVARDVHQLAGRLRQGGRHLTIETAGTVPPAGIVCDLASISPKLSSSTPAPGTIAETWRERHEATRLQPDVLRAWLDAGYPYQLKFVLGGKEDLAEVEDLLGRINRPVPPHKVLLMPEGIDADVLRERSLALVEVCRSRGYRLCPRLHVELFGNRLGT